MRKILLILALVVSHSWAGFFIEDSQAAAKPVRELPKFFYGGAVDVGFYLTSFDVGLNLSGEYHITEHNSVGASARALFFGGLFEFGADWKYFFGGSLGEYGFDDYFRLSVSGILFEKNDEFFFPPVVAVGYGRDFLPFEKANVVIRLEVGLGYVFGESIPDADEDSFISRETNLLAHFNIGVLFF